MTGFHATRAPISQVPMNVDSAVVSSPLVGPYAKPNGDAPSIMAIDAVLIDAIRASAGPYVPAPLRSRPTTVRTIVPAESATIATAVTETPAVTAELPWIDAFIDETPASAATHKVNPSEVESWPLGDTTDTIRSLVHGLGPAETNASAVAPSLPADTIGQTVDFEALQSALIAPLPMWRDDDLMDIMPVRSTPDAAHTGTEHWAEKARREATTENHAEAAATLLEAVASRVRDGSLVVPGYLPSMSDAAGLAAALAALLSTHE